MCRDVLIHKECLWKLLGKLSGSFSKLAILPFNRDLFFLSETFKERRFCSVYLDCWCSSVVEGQTFLQQNSHTLQ